MPFSMRAATRLSAAGWLEPQLPPAKAQHIQWSYTALKTETTLVTSRPASPLPRPPAPVTLPPPPPLPWPWRYPNLARDATLRQTRAPTGHSRATVPARSACDVEQCFLLAPPPRHDTNSNTSVDRLIHLFPRMSSHVNGIDWQRKGLFPRNAGTAANVLVDGARSHHAHTQNTHVCVRRSSKPLKKANGKLLGQASTGTIHVK